MQSRTWTSILVLASLAMASVALGFQPEVDSQALVISRPEHALQMNPQHSRALATAALATDALGGTWSVYAWNPITNTPRWVIGSGATPAGAAAAVTDDTELAASAAAWAVAHPAFFQTGAGALAGAEVVRGRGKVAAHFEQRFHGIPVADSWSTLVYSDRGRLVAFGANLYPDIDVSPVPLVAAATASSIARQDLPFDPATDTVQGEPELLILPIEHDTGATYHLVWRVRVTTTTPPGIWVTHVDAHSGQILWRYNDMHFLYEGDVRSDVEINGYCDGTTPDVALNRLEVTVSNVGSAVTDSTGAFSIDGSAGNQTIDAAMDGPRLRVINQGGSNAAFSGPIAPDTPTTVGWDDGNSDPSERDVFYWVNATYHYMELLDPGWTYSKYTVNVNVNSTCNANWSGTVMNFFREGGGCAATGRIGDVVAHEFGHGIQQRLVGGQGNEGLGEGNGDISGTFMTDDPLIGRGFSLNACSSGIRNCENSLIYPNDVVGHEIHSAGRVICGFNWDTRQAMELTWGPEDGKTKTAELWYWSRKVLRPVFQPDQVLAYFIIDDDDGDLSNGTPNFDDICQGATLHNFSCPDVIEGVVIQHTPLQDTIDTQNDYEVQAAIFSTEGALVADSLLVNYRINGGPFQSLQLVTTGGPNLYHAFIPAQPLNTLVQYYLQGRDVVGNRATDPEQAPGATFGFFVGQLEAAALEEMEVDPGWTVGPNTASSGIWERVDPVGIFTFIGALQVQVTPEDDHTADPGVMCWVTEQDDPGGFAGAHDVDNGVTRLVSATYDLSGESYARLEYYLWFNNDLGAHPGEDPFLFEISTNGGASWILIEARNASTGNDWELVRYELTNFVALTAQMRFRFTAQDDQTSPQGPSIVEAGVDDFALLVVPGSSSVDHGPAAVAPRRTALAQNQPNPFNPSTAIGFALAGQDRVTLRIYDVSGQQVRTLVDEVREAGRYTASWDGRDRSGAAVSSGIYFYRLQAGEYVRTRKMVLLK